MILRLLVQASQRHANPAWQSPRDPWCSSLEERYGRPIVLVMLAQSAQKHANQLTTRNARSVRFTGTAPEAHKVHAGKNLP